MSRPLRTKRRGCKKADMHVKPMSSFAPPGSESKRRRPFCRDYVRDRMLTFGSLAASDSVALIQNAGRLRAPVAGFGAQQAS